MERRVLIVENQSEFGLSMASVLKDAGFLTSLAESASDAKRELELRRPDLLVLRAELPDQSGFVFCGNVRKMRGGQNLAIILVSTDAAIAELERHAAQPHAANAYLASPFEMEELVRIAQSLAPDDGSVDENSGAGIAGEDVDVDSSLDDALSENPKTTAPAPVPPPPISTGSLGGPPKLPRRGRRSALTADDKDFLDFAFSSVADRKSELLAESRDQRRKTRYDLTTPEGKLQMLREELKTREAQLARISEIWSARERELLSVEDRVNEKDVEIQGLKMLQDDLSRRLSEAQNQLTEREREHGRQVEDLLLQKFIGEKEVIEVVSAKEKEINGLRADCSNLEAKLGTRGEELTRLRSEYDNFEKAHQRATVEFEVTEKRFRENLNTTTLELGALRGQFEALTQEHTDTISARDARYTDFEGQVRELTERVSVLSEALASARKEFGERDQQASDRYEAQGKELTARTEELRSAKEAAADQEAKLESEISRLQSELSSMTQAKADLAQSSEEHAAREAKRVAALESELAALVVQKDEQEASLQAQMQEKVERIGELEGEVEGLKSAYADQEAESRAELESEKNARLESERSLRTQLAEAQRAYEEEKALGINLNQELAQARSESEGLKGVVATRDEVLARVSNNLAEVNNSLSQLQGKHQDLERAHDDTKQELARRTSELEQELATRTNEFEQELSTRTNELEEERRNLEEQKATLETREREHAQQLENLGVELETARQGSADLAEELAESRRKFGEQVAEATRLHSELAASEDGRQALEQKLEDTAQEAKRREELLRADLGSISGELEDAQQRLAMSQQEFERRLESATKEATVRAEHIKKLEGALKAHTEDANRRIAESTAAYEAVSREFEEAQQTIQAHEQTIQGARDEREALFSEQATLKERFESQLARAEEQGNELREVIASEQARAEEALAEANQRIADSEAQRNELAERLEQYEGRHRELQTQLAAHQKRLGEFETAAESAATARARTERETHAKLQAAEQRANEASSRLASMIQEWKVADARHTKELDDVSGKFRQEIERRESVKSQEVRRLQESLQEKSKLLKVAEFELARWKSKNQTVSRPAPVSRISQQRTAVPHPPATAGHREEPPEPDLDALLAEDNEPSP